MREERDNENGKKVRASWRGKLLMLFVSVTLSFGVGEIICRMFFSDSIVLFPRFHAPAQYGEFTLRKGQETATIDRSRLTKLFFGPERVSDFASDVFPLPLWQWPVERV